MNPRRIMVENVTRLLHRLGIIDWWTWMDLDETIYERKWRNNETK